MFFYGRRMLKTAVSVECFPFRRFQVADVSLENVENRRYAGVYVGSKFACSIVSLFSLDRHDTSMIDKLRRWMI